MSKTIVADSSILIAMDRRRKLNVLINLVVKRNIDLVVSPSILHELVIDAREASRKIYPYSPVLAEKLEKSAEKFAELVNKGIIKVVSVNYAKYSKLKDSVKKRIAKLSSKPEHLVEKADIDIIVLSIQLKDSGRSVILASDDKTIIKTVKNFSREIRTANSKTLFKQLQQAI